MRSVVGVFVALLGATCGGSSGSGPNAEAVPVLDQRYEAPAYDLASGVPAEKAQTFKVGVTGRLVRIDLLAFRQNFSSAGDLVGEVWSTFGGFPAGNDAFPLAHVVVPSLSIPNTVGALTIDLPGAGLPVTTGTVLAVVLRASSGGQFTISAGGDNGYPSGAHFARDPSNGVDDWVVLPGVDIPFATYVVPE